MLSLFKKKNFLSKEQQELVVEAIRQAELSTTGEIRVYMEANCDHDDPMKRASELFYRLGMDNTVSRNAVIVYLAYEDKKFALYGDKEIYIKAGGKQFWEKAAAKLASNLKEKKYVDGLVACINELGAAMSISFPFDPSITKNELPDEIVFGK